MSQSLTIKDHAGLGLAALYDEPSSKGPYPLVILLHGFTGWKEEEHISTLARDLAKAGIAALCVEAPGSGESEGTWAEHYRLTNYIADVADIISYAKSKLPVDPKHIGIWGHSMGGFAALAAAVRAQGQIAALCGCEPSSGPKGKVNNWEETGWANFSNRKFKDIRLPYEFFTDRQQYNALDEAPKLKMPALFIAGTRDESVSPKSVKATYDAAPEPKTYLEFNAPHNYKDYPELRSEINTATVEFFTKYLRPHQS